MIHFTSICKQINIRCVISVIYDIIPLIMLLLNMNYAGPGQSVCTE